jgi:hypothetical protein
LAEVLDALGVGLDTKGLAERERITPDQAFDILRRACQHLNVKLQEVAAYVVDTGEVPSDWNP